MKTAAPAAAQVERQEAEAREPECEREHEDGAVRVLGRPRRSRSRRTRRRERRGEAVHVVEQVERVGDADEPEQAIATRETSLPITSTLRPLATTIAAALNCAASFAIGAGGSRSSTSPAAKRSVTAAEDAPELAGPVDDPAIASATAIPAAKPAKIPTPPNVGVGRSCQRSPVGDGDEAPRRTANGGGPESTRYATEPRRSRRRAHAGIARKGAKSPAGRTFDRPATYLAAMGVYADLFRYRELFGSLFRRDLRAKYRGSVLGLAWSLAKPVVLMLVYLLVFSVFWKAQPRSSDALLAVPPLRAAGLGVLRDLVAGGVAEPAREREPDPQGAVPAPARPALERRRRSSSRSP